MILAKLLRLASEKTLDEIGSLTGLSKTPIHQLESGKTKPHESTIGALSVFYGVPGHLLTMEVDAESVIRKYTKYLMDNTPIPVKPSLAEYQAIKQHESRNRRGIVSTRRKPKPPKTSKAKPAVTPGWYGSVTNQKGQTYQKWMGYANTPQGRVRKQIVCKHLSDLLLKVEAFQTQGGTDEQR